MIPRLSDVRSGALAAAMIGLTLVLVGVRSRFAILSVLLDGIPACLVLGPAAGLGFGLVPLLRLGPMPIRWHILAGSALGIGATALFVLGLGLAGVLSRSFWLVLLIAFAVVGLVRVRALLETGRPSFRSSPELDVDEPIGPRLRFLWLLAIPFLAMAILAASNAPGFIWREEGFGYDVLEYHLQLPREYFDAGRIQYAPHNVYGNFPANVEMLYLIAMILLGDPREVGIVCNMMHLLLGGFTVFAAWTIGRDWSARCGLVCGLAMATCGWWVYLAGLAYVELGMLFFGFVAVGALLRGLGLVIESDGVGRLNIATPIACGRWLVLSGLCAGFACGCKYTAVPMIAMPLVVGIVGTVVLCRIGRVSTGSIQAACGSIGLPTSAAVFLLAFAASFGPWAVKNVAMTGNPVFPLANNWFRAMPQGWGIEEQQRWDRGHTPTAQEAGLAERATAMWRNIPADHYQRFGPLLLILGLGGLVFRRLDSVDWLLVALLLFQLVVWAMATHLYSRFAIVILIPLVLLAGRTGMALRSSLGGLMIAGAAWNGAFAYRLLSSETPWGAPASWIYSGDVPGYEFFGAMNRDLGPKAKILLVGESRAFYVKNPVEYTVVFNHSDLAEQLSSSPSARQLRDWLTARGVTHVFVNRQELNRLRRTYGLPLTLSSEVFKEYEGDCLRVDEEFRHLLQSEAYAVLYAVVGD